MALCGITTHQSVILMHLLDVWSRSLLLTLRRACAFHINQNTTQTSHELRKIHQKIAAFITRWISCRVGSFKVSNSAPNWGGKYTKETQTISLVWRKEKKHISELSLTHSLLFTLESLINFITFNEKKNFPSFTKDINQIKKCAIPMLRSFKC